MRLRIVAILAVIESLVVCAIVACSLQLSHRIVRSDTVGNVARILVRSSHRFASSTETFVASTRRIAEDGVHVRITIGDA